MPARALTRTLLASMLAALVVLTAAAAPASAGERARLTWDTDETDIDLHVWDEGGQHAWFGDRDGIAKAELSQDIIDGFGPEHFEEFVGYENYPYAYGICYFGSNRDDGVVPATVATVTLTDPAGSVRTFKRTLTTEGEAYLLGPSPAGGVDFAPADGSWCRGGRGPVHPVTDPGPADTTAPASFGQCTRERRRIGAVEVCADSFTVDGTVYAARGAVRLNGSVALGDGPIDVSTDAQTITSRAAVPLGVDRSGTIVPVLTGVVRVDAKPTRDPASGRDGVAALTVTAPQAPSQPLRLAGLGVRFEGASIPLYLDARDGGGLIGTARVALPLFGDRPSAETLTVGVHGSSAAPTRVLAGVARFGDFDFGGGWKFTGLELSYTEQGNTWSAKGGIATPAFGLELGGTLADGQLDALSASLARDVPLGTSGFILSKVGGSVSGLARPPLKISAAVSGRWGSVPKQNAAVLTFKDVTLTLDFSGRASLTGKVFLLRDGSPIAGELALGMAVNPFSASGSFKVGAKLGPLDLRADAGLAMNAQHFTATGGVDGRIRDLKLASARGVVSDRGFGASGEVCIGLFGRCSVRTVLGFGMNWDDSPNVRWIGSDTSQFVTVRAAAAGRRTIEVERGRPLLFLDADGPDGTAGDITLVSPKGKRYTTARERPDSRVVKDPAIGYTGLTVLTPTPGRWRILTGDAAAGTRVVAQTIRKVQPLRLSAPRPAGTARKPLQRRGPAIRLRWASRGLPATARADVYLTTDRTQPGTLVASNRRLRGTLRLQRRLVPAGAVYVRLIAHDRSGAPLGDATARWPIHMAP